MKSAADRVAAFRVRMQGEALGPAASRCLTPVGGLDTESMNAFITRTGQLYMLELQIKQLMDGQGVSTILYPFYMSFGRNLWALRMRGYTATGPTSIFQTETAIRQALWVARGLSLPLLAAVAALVTHP
jgi:hypothetical protein